MSKLSDFNEQVREWADRQPPKYRKSARAFGYRCNVNSHSFSGTIAWISRLSRRYGYGVSERTLKSHLKDYEASGVIKVERRRNLDKNMSSVYYVNLDAVIGERSEPDPWGLDEPEVSRNDSSTARPSYAEMIAERDRAEREACKCAYCRQGEPDLCEVQWELDHPYDYADGDAF